MFLRDCKINSVSIIKTNVAAVKKIKDGEKNLRNKYITVPVFIKLDSLGGRSLAHVLWSLGSNSCKRLCYPGACCLLESEVCVFSHRQVIHCEFPPCSIVYSASYLLWVQEREFIWQSGILKADLTRAEWARSHAALLIRNNAIHNCFCYRRFSIFIKIK